MANSRHTSTLDLKVNAREVSALGKLINRVFGRKAPREFNTAIQQVNRSLEANIRHTGKVAEAMKKVDRESKAYTRLSKQLQQANKDAKQLAQSLERISRTGGGRGAAGGGGVSAGGFGRGVAGGMLGAQLGMPGMGAMTTALGAIPVGGAIAAGSLMAAAGTYQSHVGHARARMQATPHLASTASLANFRGTRTAAARQDPNMIAGTLHAQGGGALGQVDFTGSTVLEQMRMGLQIAAGKRTMDRTGGMRGTVGTYSHTGLGVHALAGGLEADRVRGQARIAEQVRKIEAGEMNPAQAHPAAQTAAARRAAFTQKGGTVTARAVNTDDYVTAGAQFGVSPNEALQQAAGASRAAGAPIGPEDFGQMLALERITGIGSQQQGGFMRGLRRTGGEGGVDTLTDVMDEAIQRGLNASEVADELQRQTGFLEQQSQRGIKLDQGAFLSMNQALEGVGIQGYRAGDISRGFAGGGQRIGMQGPKSGVDIRMMRAMGYTGTGGVEEYAGTRLKMQNPSQVLEALPTLLSDIRGAGGGRMGPEMLTLMTQQILRGVGVEVGPGEAQALIQGDLSIEEFKRKKLTNAKETARGLTPGVLGVEAELEAQRIAVGGTVATTMQNLARTTNLMAESAGNFAPILDRVTGQFVEFAGVIAMASENLMDLVILAGGGVSPSGGKHQ